MSSSQDIEQQSTIKISAVRRPWTEDEDSALVAAVKQYGSSRGPGSAWSLISKAVGSDRTNKDCRKRWFHSLDPNLRKGKWSLEEDEELRRLYNELGPQWKDIALRIPGRKDDQVSKRWRDVLDPDLTPKTPWASLEDALLLQLFEEHGAKWTVIADHLPGRSPLACRNRSRKYLKASKRHRGVLLNNDKSVDESSISPQFDVASSGDSMDMFMNWQLPDTMDDPQSSATALQFDYNICQPPVSTESMSIFSAGTGNADLPSMDTHNIFDNAGEYIDGQIGNNLDSEAISQWISSLNTDLSSIVPNSNLERVTQNDFKQAPIRQVDQSSHATVSNVWGLLLALDSGQPSINVDSKLLRQLMSDATQCSVNLFGEIASQVDIDCPADIPSIHPNTTT